MRFDNNSAWISNDVKNSLFVANCARLKLLNLRLRNLLLRFNIFIFFVCNLRFRFKLNKFGLRNLHLGCAICCCVFMIWNFACRICFWAFMVCNFCFAISVCALCRFFQMPISGKNLWWHLATCVGYRLTSLIQYFLLNSTTCKNWLSAVGAKRKVHVLHCNSCMLLLKHCNVIAIVAC